MMLGLPTKGGHRQLATRLAVSMLIRTGRQERLVA
jgi:hypothetical protein